MKENEKATQEPGGMGFSERAMHYGMNPSHFGDMDQPDGHARITGPCGDTVDMYLCVREEKIDKVTFVTDGCMFSIAACDAAARLAIGRSLLQCLDIDQRSITEHLDGLPDDHAHCALLAATTLHKAVNNYIAEKTPSVAPTNPFNKRSQVTDRHARPYHRKMKDRSLL